MHGLSSNESPMMLFAPKPASAPDYYEDYMIKIIKAKEVIPSGNCAVSSAEIIKFPKGTSSGPDLLNKGYISNKYTEKLKPVKKGRGRPSTHGLTGSPTYGSFRNAKARCENPKSPQYDDYGGRGIEFRFNDITELVADIGLRPEGMTLDRIDPNGHYEFGNVRWATPKEQANNRRPRKDFSTDKALQNHLLKIKPTHQTWLNIGQAWQLSVRLFNDLDFEDGLMSDLDELQADTLQPEASWEAHVKPQDPYNDPGYIFLPSLASPMDYVVIRGGPFTIFRKRGYTTSGIIHGLKDVPLKLNLHSEEIDLLDKWLNSSQTSLCYTCPTMRIALHQPPEGRLLAFAARVSDQISTRFLPAHELSRLAGMDELSSIKEHLIIIPDLQIGDKDGFGISKNLLYSIKDFLTDRVKYGYKTLIVSECPERMPLLLTLIQHEFKMVEMDLIPTLDSIANASPPNYGCKTEVDNDCLDWML